MRSAYTMDDLVLQDDPYQPSDVASFNAAGVPSLAFFTGTHVDYHKPSDTADKINYEKLERILRLLYLSVWELADQTNPPRFLVPSATPEPENKQR